MVPTLGASAVVLALQLCDQVSLAGFGYDMQHPEARLHYYETIRMDAMKAQVSLDPLPNSGSHFPLTLLPIYLYVIFIIVIILQVVHDVSAEKLFLRDLVTARAVTDLTGALGASSMETNHIVNSTCTPPSRCEHV